MRACAWRLWVPTHTSACSFARPAWAYEHMHITAHEHMLICSLDPFRSRRLGVHSSFVDRWKPRHHCKSLISLCTQNNVYIFACLYPVDLYPVDPCKNGKKRQVIEKQFILWLEVTCCVDTGMFCMLILFETWNTWLQSYIFHLLIESNHHHHYYHHHHHHHSLHQNRNPLKAFL
jgi:hypothetical protein